MAHVGVALRVSEGSELRIEGAGWMRLLLGRRRGIQKGWIDPQKEDSSEGKERKEVEDGKRRVDSKMDLREIEKCLQKLDLHQLLLPS